MKSKCCNSDVFIKEKSGQKCVYCKSCGKFVKNANKDDLREIEENMVKESRSLFDNHSQVSQFIDVDKLLEEIQYYKDSINKLISIIDKQVECEDNKAPLSSDDTIRKLSKVYELERVKYTLEEILNREVV